MSHSKSPLILPHLITAKGSQTLADALQAIERKYEPLAQHSRAIKRLLSAFRTTCKFLSKLLGPPLECIYLDDLVEIDARLIAYLEEHGLVHQSAIQYSCDLHKLLDEANELLGWTSKSYELRKSWEPVSQVLKKKAHGYAGIIRFAIDQGRMPSNFTNDVMDRWKQDMLGRGRSLLTVLNDESHWRKTLKRAEMQQLFSNFNLASKNPTKYRFRLKDHLTLRALPDLPESLRKEILDAIHWKTADEDMDDRDAALMIRTVTGENLLRHFVELYSYAVNIMGIGEIANLQELIREEVVSGFVDYLREGDRCKPQSIISKLSSIHYLVRTYPKIKGGDYSWFREKLDTLRKEKDRKVQARKLDCLPPYQAIAEIAPMLLV